MHQKLRWCLLSIWTIVFYDTAAFAHDVLTSENRLDHSGFNVFAVGGVGFFSSGGTRYVNVGQVTNQFSVNDTTQYPGYWGFGVGYQYDLKQPRGLPLLLDVSLSVYNMQSHFSGVETPAINLIPQADTLTYSARVVNWAWFVEPAMIWTQYAWQPYVMFGLGFSTNRSTSYKEEPSSLSSGAVATNLFANQSRSNFAWEVGAGLQHVIYTATQGTQLKLAGEYRYMAWGEENLGKSPMQTTLHGLDLGYFNTNLLDLRLSLQF